VQKKLQLKEELSSQTKDKLEELESIKEEHFITLEKLCVSLIILLETRRCLFLDVVDRLRSFMKKNSR